jgi:Phosphotransacetylase
MYNISMSLLDNLKNNLPNIPVRIVFAEKNNERIRTAVERASADNICTPIFADDLQDAARLLSAGEADALVAGVDYSSRDVILTARDTIGTTDNTFSSSFIMDFPNGQLITLADCATCKNPSSSQLVDIVLQTIDTFSCLVNDVPKVALLSFSTFGSGGHDPSIDKIREALDNIRAQKPNLIIEGEIQLDAAVNPEVASIKAPDSVIKGDANILITPDLNSGNILYKSIQQFAGAKAYGPILQGFNKIVSDLSRGSSVDDIYGAILISATRVHSQS